MRATATGPRPDVAPHRARGRRRRTRPRRCVGTHDDLGRRRARSTPSVYDRGRLLAGNVVTGPAIVTEMDSTTLVLPGHAATVHPSGCLLIRPLDPKEG